MTYYQEITILPDPEISPYFIWSKLYTQLHIALADLKNKHGIEHIGVSFPHYKYEERKDDKTGKVKTFATLGDKLRIFAPEQEQLQQLDLSKWLDRLTDYIHIKPIKPVPTHTQYLCVQRYRSKDPEKVISNFAKFKQISIEDARLHCAQYKQTDYPYPFIQLRSLSNEVDYRLSICQKETNQPVNGVFNVYGINTMTHQVTVPHW